MVLRTGYTWISKILLDSSNQYDHFDVQHAYVVKKIKEVMSIQTFFTRSILLEILFRYTHGLQIWSRSSLANSKKWSFLAGLSQVFQIFLRGENYSENIQMTKYEIWF